MKFYTALSSVLLAASAAVAAPTSTLQGEPARVDSALEKRATTFCSQWGSQTAGQYTFYQNLWGQASASSGSQCTTFNDLQGNTVSWSTSWTWAGGQGQVKSFPNVAVENVNKQLSAVSSINSAWKWSYTGSSLVADVSYDLWLSDSSGGANKYEIMVWLAAYGGAGPISSTGSPVATTTIAGQNWKLYKGPNGATTVFSFVSDSTITNFSGDLNLFFKYLVSSQGLSNSLWITSLQAGTEPFTGSNAVMTTSSYTISVK